jgi:hypothetical protein
VLANLFGRGPQELVKGHARGEAFESRTWLWENQVVDAVAAYLGNAGWTILEKRETRQHGIDILAEKGGETLAVEAKGGGSSNPKSSRYGKPFVWKQKCSSVATAVLSALREVSRGQHRAAIAVPDDAEYRRLIKSILPPLQSLDIEVYFVAADWSVSTALGG